MVTSRVEGFSKDAADQGVQYQYDPLTLWAQQLHIFTRKSDMTSLPATLAQFSGIIAELADRINQAGN